MTLGDHIKKRRVELRLLQEQLAEQLGVCASTVIHWERSRTTPKTPEWAGLIEFLGYDPVPVGEAISAKLVALRRRRGITQKELAHELGVDPTTLSRWELGTRAPWGRFRQLVNGALGAELRGGTSGGRPRLPSTIGSQLRTRRKQRGLSQAAAAAELGVSAPTLSRWECGRTNPARSFRRQIVAFLGSEPA